MAAMDSPAVHQHAVQAIQVADLGIRGLGHVPAVVAVQVQLLRELVPVVDLHPRPPP